MSTLTKKKVKLTGNNGGKEKVNNEMGTKEAKFRAKAKIHIHIYILKDGSVNVFAPKNLNLFREVLIQAERVMEENYGHLPENKTEEEKKVIELKPNIVIARK